MIGELRPRVLGGNSNYNFPRAARETYEERDPGAGEEESVRRAADSASYFSLIFLSFSASDMLAYDPPQLQPVLLSQ